VSVVEATEGCDINPGKCAKRAKSTKFVKQILSTYARILDFKIRETIHEQFVKQNIRIEFSTHQSATKFSMQNGKVGEGGVFSKKHLYCLSYITSGTHSF
jgi:hypothetical protein